MKTKFYFSPVLILVLFVMTISVPSIGRDGNGMPLKEETTVAFVNVNVVSMDSELILEKYTVIVKNGLIAQIGPSNDVQIPQDAEKIDGTGKYLMPGIADMHVHAWSEVLY